MSHALAPLNLPLPRFYLGPLVAPKLVGPICAEVPAPARLCSLMVVRCSRCHKMYAEDGCGGCHYHSGTHRGGFTAHAFTGLMFGWSCCKELAEDAPGCRLAAQHTPCVATAAAMSHFPKVVQKEDEVSDGLRRRAGEAKEPPLIVVKSVLSVASCFDGQRHSSATYRLLHVPQAVAAPAVHQPMRLPTVAAAACTLAQGSPLWA